MAINEAALAFEPALGLEVVEAASRLRFRAIVFVGLKVRRSRVLPASFMYFREHSFNRITDFSHFSFHMEPPGSTLLVAEVTCEPTDRVWSDEALARDWVLDDLERERILARGEVEAVHVFRARHAHPIYALGYERALETILDAFGRLANIETAGRQGLFQYVNGHVAMKMGQEAADRLCARLAAADQGRP
jgi:protoporphyrinogen oxidase